MTPYPAPHAGPIPAVDTAGYQPATTVRTVVHVTPFGTWTHPPGGPCEVCDVRDSDP